MSLLQILIIAGGVALIVFGVRFLRSGLDRLFGHSLGHSIQRLANHRIKAFFTGLAVSLLAPSTATISMLAVQSVQDRHVTARQALSVLLGAEIGLTVTVILIAFRLEQYAPLLVLGGVGLYQFSRGARSRGIGQVILSLGFIFMGISTIKATGVAIQPDGDLAKLLEIAERHPFGMAVLGGILAFALQSVTATIGLMIGLSVAGTTRLPVAVAFVVGANVGIGVTMLMLGWKHIDSRRLATGNLLCKLSTAVLFLTIAPFTIRVIEVMTTAVDKQIACAHTGFNILMATMFLPLVGPISVLVEKLLPTTPMSESPRFEPRYLMAGQIDGFALASGQSLREIMRVAEIVRSMLADLWRALKTSNEELAIAVSERDDEVDLLDAEIKKFLTRLSTLEGDQDEAGEQMRQLRYLSELETIGDIIDKNLSELVTKKIRHQVEFSDEGWIELDDFYRKVAENMLIAETAFQTRDRLLAQQLLRHKESVSTYERDLRDRHFARLKAGLAESLETSAIHLDILTHLKRINSCVTHVAYAIVTNKADTDE